MLILHEKKDRSVKDQTETNPRKIIDNEIDSLEELLRQENPELAEKLLEAKRLFIEKGHTLMKYMARTIKSDQET